MQHEEDIARAKEDEESLKSDLCTSTDAADRYTSHVSNIPKLSREEELVVARKWVAEGDQKSADILVRANMRHAVSIARKYQRYGLPMAELISEGNYGLVLALNKFDPERGLRFVTYAAYWMRAYVLKYIIQQWSLVGVGSGALRSKQFFRLRREQAQIENIVGGDKDMCIRVLADRLGQPVEKVRTAANQLASRDVSLDSPIEALDGDTMLDSMAANDTSQDELLSNCESHRRLKDNVDYAIEKLDERELFIVEFRLMVYDKMSLADIGRHFGVSRERARQLELRAKQKLREELARLNEDTAA